jgi:hypothetical protein
MTKPNVDRSGDAATVTVNRAALERIVDWYREESAEWARRALSAHYAAKHLARVEQRIAQLYTA